MACVFEKYSKAVLIRFIANHILVHPGTDRQLRGIEYDIEASAALEIMEQSLARMKALGGKHPDYRRAEQEWERASKRFERAEKRLNRNE